MWHQIPAPAPPTSNGTAATVGKEFVPSPDVFEVPPSLQQTQSVVHLAPEAVSTAGAVAVAATATGPRARPSSAMIRPSPPPRSSRKSNTSGGVAGAGGVKQRLRQAERMANVILLGEKQQEEEQHQHPLARALFLRQAGRCDPQRGDS